MELKAKLDKPYTDSQRMNFIVSYNHNLGYTIKETMSAIEAWGHTDEEVQVLERERINKLTMTKREFALSLKELGITYSKLKEIISGNEDALLEWELCERLERGNPLLDVMASEVNITPQQLDDIFISKGV